MTLSIIALIVSVICLIVSIIIYINTKKKRSKSDKDFFDSYSNEVSLREVDRKVNRLSKEVQPLIDKYKEEQEQEEVETRKKHWKSFNKWKMQKEMMNQDAGDKPICGACYNDSLEFVINYKFKEDMPYFKTNGGIGYLDVKEDYPLSAEQKCTACGHVADKWKYEE